VPRVSRALIWSERGHLSLDRLIQLALVSILFNPSPCGGWNIPYRQTMAYAQTLSPQTNHHPFRDIHSTASPPMQRRQASKQRFVAELSQCLFDFVIQLLPTQEEMAVKEDVRKLLERLIRTIEPESRLLSFGSTANGFSLRNSGEIQCSDNSSNTSQVVSHRYGSLLSHRF